MWPAVAEPCLDAQLNSYLQAAEAKKEEHRSRGKADTRTSDPKFDARFKLGYQLADKGKEVCAGVLLCSRPVQQFTHVAVQPWYARLPEAEESTAEASIAPTAGQMLPPSSQPLLALPDKPKKHKSKEKHKHKHKSSKGVSKKHGSKADREELREQLALAELRAEREAREAAERSRQRELLRSEAAKAKAEQRNR